MYITYQFLLGFLAVLGFAYYLNVPMRAIPACALGGAIGWVIFMYSSKYLDAGHIGILVGSIFIGLLGEYFSRKHRLPATVFLLAGIIPLVPGLNMYFMMYNVVMNNYDEAFKQGLNAAIISGAISIGLFLASSAYSKVMRIRSKLRNEA